MKLFTGYYRRLKVRALKIRLLAVFASIFFLPSFVPFEKMGNNIFAVMLNNQEVGMVSRPEEAESLMREARRQIASQSGELMLMESNLEVTGSEVLWGKTDDPEQITQRMAEILTESVKETLHRAYVVKINEFMVNLSSKEDVVSLLQAALDKYDSENRYQVELQLDNTRELPVLTTQIQTEEEAVEETQEVINMEAGLQADLTTVFEEAEPVGEKDFEDYELGLISME